MLPGKRQLQTGQCGIGGEAGLTRLSEQAMQH